MQSSVKLTEETGGESYGIGFTGSIPDLTPYLTDAARRLDHQYLLTFLAKPEKKAGLRSIKLRTELHNIDLGVRQGRLRTGQRVRGHYQAIDSDGVKPCPHAIRPHLR